MTKYIPRSGDSSRPQPYRLSGVKLWGWMLQADQGSLQLLCDKYLNEPRLRAGQKLEDLNLRYNALKGNPVLPSLAGKVFLCFDTVNTVTSDPNRTNLRTYNSHNSSDSNRAIFEQPSELFFCFPCQVTEGQKTRMVWYMPYIYLGHNDPSIITGREVYGFPKAWAEFDSTPTLECLSEHPESLESLKMSSDWTFISERGQDELVERRELITISKHVSQVSDQNSFQDELKLISEKLCIKVDVVNLKQFRAVSNSDSACYQAITEAPFTACAWALGNLRWIGTHDVIIKRNIGSHPFVSELGLQDQRSPNEPRDNSTIRQTAFAFLNRGFDFRLEAGRVIWSANQVNSTDA